MNDLRSCVPMPILHLQRALGVSSYAALWRVLAGRQRSSPDLAIRIHRATAGAVPCWELRPDLWAPGQVPPELSHDLPPEAA